MLNYQQWQLFLVVPATYVYARCNEKFTRNGTFPGRVSQGEEQWALHWLIYE
jgi:hypothetical protein